MCHPDDPDYGDLYTPIPIDADKALVYISRELFSLVGYFEPSPDRDLLVSQIPTALRDLEEQPYDATLTGLALVGTEWVTIEYTPPRQVGGSRLEPPDWTSAELYLDGIRIDLD